jgi:nucleotide-binding universal stress UspA family protein
MSKLEEKGVILVPTDFEEPSLRALSVALDLAPRLGGEVVLAHVYQLPVYAYPNGEPVPMALLQEDFLETARRSLQELAAARGGLRTVLKEGNPAACILALVGTMKPRMVVMGTHGRRGLTRLLLGSVTEQIVRQSPCPVLTVHAEPTAKAA